MRKTLLVILISAVLLAPLVGAVPNPPHEVYSKVSYSDGSVASGISVEARISGEVVDSDSTDSSGEYVIHVPSDYSDEEFTIYIDDSSVKSYTTVSGKSVQLNETISEEEKPGDGGEVTEDGDTTEEPEPISKSATVEDGKAQADIGTVEQDQSVEVSIPDSENKRTVYSVKFKTANKVENVEVTVDELDEKPEGVESAGTAYKYQEIKVKNTEDEDIESGTISFKVEKSFLEERGRDPEDVVIKRYSNGWENLPTSKVGETDTHYKFQASSTGFSYFAVALKEENIEVTNESDIRLVDFVASPTEGKSPLVVNLIATYKNTGSASGEKTVEFRTTDGVFETKVITLEPGQSKKVEASLRLNQTGQHSVRVEGLSETIEVKPADKPEFKPSPEGMPWMLITAGISALLLAIVLVLIFAYEFGSKKSEEYDFNEANEGKTENREKHECEECGKKFDTKRGLHIHIGMEHPEKEDELFAEDEEKEE